MMRAVWVGLLGVVLAAGGTEAKSCRLDGLDLKASEFRAPADKSLADARFKVVRQTSHFKPVFKGYWTKRGTITVEVAGPKGRFVVAQDYEPTSSPWVTASSQLSTSKNASRNWAGRNRAQEAKFFGKDPAFYVYDGPLAGYSLAAIGCK